MDKKTFGNYVRECRIKQALTQDNLAEILSVNINSISHIERGINYPDVNKLFLLISTLNMSIDTLIYKETKLCASKLPDILNEKIERLSNIDRKILFDTLETLIDGLLNR